MKHKTWEFRIESTAVLGGLTVAVAAADGEVLNHQVDPAPRPIPQMPGDKLPQNKPVIRVFISGDEAHLPAIRQAAEDYGATYVDELPDQIPVELIEEK